METSGIMGYVTLENPHTKNHIILFSDIHDGVKYCKDSDSKFIDEIFDKVKKDYLILLEEVPRLGVDLVELWPGAEHTQRLKNFYLENSNIVEGIDIRPYLITFSFQKYYIDKLSKGEENIKMKDYLEMEVLFNQDIDKIKKIIYPKVYYKIYNLLKKLPSHSGVIKYYNELKNTYIKMKAEINIEETFLTTLKKNRDWFEKLDELKSNIMDWYTILLMSANNNKNIIVHFGLAHFVNTLEQLKKINFKVIDEKGLTSYTGIKNCACIKL